MTTDQERDTPEERARREADAFRSFLRVGPDGFSAPTALALSVNEITQGRCCSPWMGILSSR